MSDERPEKLSDIDINVHGFTSDDVIQGRKARNEMIREAAIRGNELCIQSEWLDAQARSMGLDITYDEDLDDLDLE